MANPNTTWSRAPSSNPATSWSNDPAAAPTTDWDSGHSFRDWETQTLEWNETEDWDVLTENMGPNTPWTRVP